MARTPAREAAILEVVRVALQPPSPLEGTRRPDEAGTFAYRPECADGMGVGTGLDQGLSTPPARLARLVRRCAGIVVKARLFADTSTQSALQQVAAQLGVDPNDPLVAQTFANMLVKERLALAADLDVAPHSPVISSVVTAARGEDRNVTVFYLALAALTAARERSLAAILTLALAATAPPVEAEAGAPAARSGAPPGAERTPRQQRVCLAARGRTAKESGDAGLPLLPTEGCEATCAGASAAAA